jgi:hypothetical protein
VIIFVTRKELNNYGVPNWCPASLNKYIDEGLFLPPLKLSKSRLAWKETDIQFYINALIASGRPQQLWPVNSRPKLNPGSSGRPRGSRVIWGADGKGHLVRPEALDAEQVA